MSRDVIQTPLAPAPVGPYNQAIRASGVMVFCSGQIALDPATGTIVGQGDVAQQTVQVMQNLEAVLKAAGAAWSDVVKTTVFLADMNDFATVNEIYARYFDEATAPARACVEVARLPKEVQVEVDCIAVVG
jgi:2-iminobutanoate/2-iminopropanoate deaminase